MYSLRLQQALGTVVALFFVTTSLKREVGNLRACCHP